MALTYGAPELGIYSVTPDVDADDCRDWYIWWKTAAGDEGTSTAAGDEGSAGSMGSAPALGAVSNAIAISAPRPAGARRALSMWFPCQPEVSTGQSGGATISLHPAPRVLHLANRRCPIIGACPSITG
jgi:hypothetical protein